MLSACLSHEYPLLACLYNKNAIFHTSTLTTSIIHASKYTYIIHMKLIIYINHFNYIPIMYSEYIVQQSLTSYIDDSDFFNKFPSK